MSDSYIIDGKLLVFVGGFLTLSLGVLGWLARAYHQQIIRSIEAMDAKIDKLDKKIDGNHDKLDKKIDEKVDAASARLEAKIDGNFDKLDKKADRNHDKLDKKIDEKVDAASARLEAKGDGNFDKLDKKADQLDKKGEERHREVQATLLDLTSKVGRLESGGGVRDGSADRSGQPSSRRNNDSAPTPRDAPDPARIAERHDRSMVPLAGVRSEPAVPAGLVRQAVPGQKQTGQEDSKSSPEPPAEDAPDTAR